MLLQHLMDRADIIVITFSVYKNRIQPLHLIAVVGMVAVEVSTSDVRCFRCAVTLWAMLITDTAFSLPMLADSNANAVSYVCYG